MSDSTVSREFVDLLTGSQLRLYRYIAVLVASHVEAEDILQNANLVILRKCDQFQLGTDFLAWSMGIAYLEVLKHRAGRKRGPYGLSDETLGLLATEAVRENSMLERRNAALPDCMTQLSLDDLTLVTDHYFRGLSWEAIAQTLGRTSSSVRHSICRIRRELKRCIDAAIGREERA